MNTDFADILEWLPPANWPAAPIKVSNE